MMIVSLIGPPPKYFFHFGWWLMVVVVDHSELSTTKKIFDDQFRRNIFRKKTNFFLQNKKTPAVSFFPKFSLVGCLLALLSCYLSYLSLNSSDSLIERMVCSFVFGWESPNILIHACGFFSRKIVSIFFTFILFLVESLKLIFFSSNWFCSLFLLAEGLLLLSN